MAERLSHSVVTTDAPIAPAVIRTKFDRPDAAAMRSGGSPERVRDSSGRKKVAIAAPWMMVGMMMCAGSASVLKPARMKDTQAKMKNAMDATMRGSRRVMLRPRIGVIRIARRPTGAVMKPASVAV